MLLGFIFSILTATYTLSSNNTVVLEGDAPEYSEVRFERSSTTGKKGQMTDGNSTLLSLKGWDGCTIQSVMLEMHSNSKSGAGSLEMKIGKRKVWKIDDKPFDDNDWAGRYSNDWVKVSKELSMDVGDDEDVTIHILSTENSLYINSYTIVYEPALPKCHTVSFITGMDDAPDPIIQCELDGMIVLPQWRDSASWYFIGWSETEVLEDEEISNILLAGTEYLPRRNTRLWAVYSDVKEVVAIDDYQSGEYVMTMWDQLTEFYESSGMTMIGSIKDGKIELAPAPMYKNIYEKRCLNMSILDDMIYRLDFEDDSLSITHIQSGDIVSYEGNKLKANVKNRWNYKVLADKSLAIYLSNELGNTYALRFSVSTVAGTHIPFAQTQRIDVENWVTDGFWLFPIVYPKYTSWPFGKIIGDEDEQQEDMLDIIENGIFLMNIANYKLYAKDKKKYLIPSALVP